MRRWRRSRLDSLTGLLGRRSLRGRFAEIAEQAALTDAWVCALGCELDGSADEAAIREAAEVLRGQLRSFELLYRLRGGVFLVLLPGLTVGEGRDVADRAWAALREASLHNSMGVAAARGAEVTRTALLGATADALAAARRHGGDRVVTYGDDGETRLAGDQARRRAA
jgi:GGDEF domain-containing protein